jgi:hypothetical protein
VGVGTPPRSDGFNDDDTATEAAALPTVTATAADVLPVSLPSPPYTAVRLCVPTARFAAVIVPDPPLSVAVPIAVAPSRNCTVPVAAAGDTVAVSCTDCPNATEVLLADNDVAVVAFTVCPAVPVAAL